MKHSYFLPPLRALRKANQWMAVHSNGVEPLAVRSNNLPCRPKPDEDVSLLHRKTVVPGLLAAPDCAGLPRLEPGSARPR